MHLLKKLLCKKKQVNQLKIKGTPYIGVSYKNIVRARNNLSREVLIILH